MLKRRAVAGWQVKPGAAGTGDVEFTAPRRARRGRLARRGEPRRPHRPGAPAAARHGQHRQDRHDARAAAPNGASRWRSSWSRTRSASKYELRGTESVGPKIGEELMRSGILAVVATHGRHRDLRLVPLRMAVRRRRPDRHAARRDLDRRPLRAAQARLQPDGARRAADHRRLLDQRHRRDLRPRAREHAALQEAGPDRAARTSQHQRDAVAHA